MKASKFCHSFRKRLHFFQAVSVLGHEQFSASIPGRAPVRWKHSTPFNTVVMFVPHQEAWVVERMGKYHRILEPGLNVLVPVLDKIKYVQSLKEIAIDIPQQSAITIGKTKTISCCPATKINFLFTFRQRDPEHRRRAVPTRGRRIQGELRC